VEPVKKLQPQPACIVRIEVWKGLTGNGMKTALIVLLIFAGLIGVAAMMFLQKPMWLFYWQELRIGNEIVSRVEAFQMSHRHLPETLQEVGFSAPEDLDKVFYRKIDDDKYCLWFGTTLGESETYRSRVKKWEEGNECP
jgi:hypothetical protein